MTIVYIAYYLFRNTIVSFYLKISNAKFLKLLVEKDQSTKSSNNENIVIVSRNI